MPDFDIIVIGGGMVGAACVALLTADRALDDLRIALVEVQGPGLPPPEDDIDVRVSAVSRASERILTRAGAWEHIAPATRSAYSDMVVWDMQGAPRGHGCITFSASEIGEPNLGYIIENRRMQWALWEGERFRKRVVALQAGLTGIAFADEYARITLDDGRSCTAGLLIAADGSASTSRQLAGIQLQGARYDQHAVVTHVSTERPHQHTAWQRFLRKGPLAFLPLVDGRSSIVWSTTPDHAEHLVTCEPQQFERDLAEASAHVLGAVKLTAPRAMFPLQWAHVHEYCRPRFVLIGDAAHIVHPLAGQGVNLGMLDAAALVQTLSQAYVAGVRSVELGEARVLRRYERWRKSENALALGLIDGLKHLFGATAPAVGPLRRTGLSLLDRTPAAKRFLIMRALGLAGEVPEVVRTA
jgi:2-octaprenylphenol hydroxylase